MQIKTILRFHLTPIWMAVIKKSINNKCWWGCREIGTSLHSWWEYKLVQLLWRSLWRFLRKLGIDSPYDPAIPLLGIFPKELKSQYYSDICISMFIAAQVTKDKLWKQPRCPQQTNGSQTVVYSHNGILLSHKEEQNYVICGKMDGSRKYYAKWD